MKKLLFSLLAFLSFFVFAGAQNVGIGTTTPDVKAKLHVQSNNQGFLMPVLSQSEEDVLFSGAVPLSLMVYNSSRNQFRYYQNGANSLLSQTGMGDLFLAGGTTRNTIDFGQTGITPPTGAEGWKLKLFTDPTLTNSYGFGIESSTLWSNTREGGSFKWYAGGDVLLMSMNPTYTNISSNLALGGINSEERLYVNGTTKMTGKLRVNNSGGGGDLANQTEALFVGGTTQLNGNTDINGTVDIDFAINDAVSMYNTKFGLLNLYAENAFEPDSEIRFGGYGSNLFYAITIEQGNASKPGGGVWIAPSDKRLKENITDYSDGLAQLRQVRPVRYNYKRGGRYPSEPTYTGIIAQDLLEIAPYMVENGGDYYSVDPSSFTYMLINAVQELDTANNEKTDIITEQSAQILNLEARLQRIEAMLSER